MFVLILNYFRREIVQYACRVLLDCVQLLFCQTYISISFLMIYGTMWFLDIRFDPHFFAVASCLLAYMRTTVVEFFSYAIKDFVNYMSAQRRIQVCSRNFICTVYLILFTTGISSA
jgi:hypothetical protein